MAVRTLSDLTIDEHLQKAIRPHTPAERAALKAEIIKDGAIHDPILYARLDGGGYEVVVDGHGRAEIYEELANGTEEERAIEMPACIEVEALYGKSVDEAMLWIVRHQISRRNENSLDLLYGVGKEFRNGLKTSAEIAAEYNLTPQRVRHAGTLADSIDDAEKEFPGSKEEILNSDLSPAFVRETGPEDLVRSAKSGAKERAPKGPLEHFSKLTNEIAKMWSAKKAASRCVNDLLNEEGPTKFSEDLLLALNELNFKLQDVDEKCDEWVKAVAIGR
jgi:hypothetical protein